MAVQDIDIPYPSQHTMSSNHRPASDMPFKCFRCSIAKKEGGECVCVWGGGAGDRLETPLKPIHFLWCFLHLLLFLYGLGGKLVI